MSWVERDRKHAGACACLCSAFAAAAQDTMADTGLHVRTLNLWLFGVSMLVGCVCTAGFLCNYHGDQVEDMTKTFNYVNEVGALS